MTRLGGALHTACSSPADGAAREAMLLGSCEAGIAFSNSSVTLIHGMSRPLGASFHIPHGERAPRGCSREKTARAQDAAQAGHRRQAADTGRRVAARG